MDTSVRRLETPYSRRARTATYWSNKANDLHAAAGAVWFCMDDGRSAGVASSLGLGTGFSMYAATNPVYKMLCGMALELALKAVVVSKGEKASTTHNLVKLASDAGAKYTVRERGVLELLTEYVVWDGRYPVPKKPEFMEKQNSVARKVLYRPERLGPMTIFSPVRPSPMSWEEFQKIWVKAWKNYVPSRE